MPSFTSSERRLPLVLRVSVLCLALTALLGTASASERAVAPDIRVRLFQDTPPASVTLAVASGQFRLATSGDQDWAGLMPGESLRITRSGSTLRLLGSTGTSAVTHVKLDPDDDHAAFTIRVELKGKTIERSYHGALDIRPDREDANALLLVNHVPLESYVAAVVTSEYGLDDVEGTKAMAVLARTYAVKNLGQTGAEYDHVDHALSQVYRGLDGLDPAAVAAAYATAGEVVLYHGALAEAVYHAESGGHTADNNAVWNGRPVDYLRGVADPFANRSPYASWSFNADRQRLLDGLTGLAGGTVTGFTISGRSDDGRVAEVKLLKRRGGTIAVSGNEFRLAVIRTFGATALKSTRFDVSVRRGSYRFEGSGFGHGVGVSQWGAHEMARRGYTYDEIIAFYLRGTEIARVADLSPTIRPLAAAETELRQTGARPVTPDSTIATIETHATTSATEITAKPATRRIGW